MDADGEQISVSVSYGISSIEDVGVDDPHSLLRKADEMLYNAKEQKK
jgi:PleD family two-component response regulator